MSRADNIETVSHESLHFEPSEAFRATSRIPTRAAYDSLYRESLDSPDTFWRRETAELRLRKPWTETLKRDGASAKWFEDAELNVTESCLDRHLGTQTASKRALIWEAETGEVQSITYGELHARTVAFAAALKGLGVGRGDRVVIYMGVSIEAAIGMLACARLGATHSVVFGGFAAESLRNRINDCGAKVVLTQDAAPRRGRLVPLKQTVDEALTGCPSVQQVVMWQRVGSTSGATLKAGRDRDWLELERAASKSEDPLTVVDAEHPLFILYTSGSTGKPKGVLHTSLGYLAGVHLTTKYVFDLQPDDIYWCTADIGWITGHSYVVYGPLSNGATCFLYEGAPNFPDWSRFWQMIEKHKITILYTAPTAIRAFIQAGDDWVARHDLSSLRLLGSVGEPINPEAWRWYHEKIGGGRCPIVDTWWQTETGSIMLTTLPGAHYAKPGATGLPFFGVEPAVVHTDGTAVAERGGGFLIIQRPWPSMLRTIWGDDERYRKQYFEEVPGNVYFTGDGAHRDPDGYFQVIGRIDDVLNVAGHRIGTAEVESSLVSHAFVAEAAAVGRPDAIKGQGLVVFVTLTPGTLKNAETRKALLGHVAGEIGKFAAPDEIRFADALPKTRSGKIMRRLLKDIASGIPVSGDLSTLEDPSVLTKLQENAQ
jgi:acetyl-CoA synthetase